jgi:uncharacterized protein (DUF1697 family)
MSRYVALLRGIAPSGTNMTNDKLRGVFEDLGFSGVGSVLSSGNITFDSADSDVPALEERVEKALADGLGLHSRTIIRDSAQLRTLLNSDPFPGLRHSQESYLTATFLKAPAAVGGTPSDPPAPDTCQVRYDPTARVLLCVIDNRVPGTSTRFMSWLEKCYGKDVTTRSWLTVRRIIRDLEG